MSWKFNYPTLKLLNFAFQLHLQIWRQVEEGRRRYRLIGQTVFVAEERGRYYLLLHPDERIEVKEGDILGKN